MSQSSQSGAWDMDAVASRVGRVWCRETCSESVEDEGKGCITFRLTFNRPVSDDVLQCLRDRCSEALIGFSGFSINEVVEFGAGYVVERECLLDDVLADSFVHFKERASFLEVLAVADAGLEDLFMLAHVQLQGLGPDLLMISGNMLVEPLEPVDLCYRYILVSVETMQRFKKLPSGMLVVPLGAVPAYTV